ncbi:aminoglycoside phosphotransferase family protein [Amycolatopsis mediterranei]|uniref:aminoglycoside phosphotransferase family protein n=1 Tax=Amycolatopsis mediterranei TaxID=33910 RepID=UPI0008FFC63F|nr:aminoglycoside phosphotransferase family protein [Amycolatopsis mediterranei]UZF72920.1 aminoglycoside phosphotransferase family protein [Amycolatopsis mediterranei]
MSQAESLTETSARELADAACKKAGIDGADAELIRIGSNAVFRLPGRIILRIGRERDGFEGARRQVGVAHWLASENFPANRAMNIPQPVDVSGHPATFWQSVSEEEKYAPIADVAEIIRNLHELRAPTGLDLEKKKPFTEIEGRLNESRSLTRDDEAYLRQRIGELKASYERLEFPLPQGVIHGDANVGNVLLSREGTPCLIDLDSFCIGPREWDLVQTALFYERFGWHTADEYRTFVNVYGFDIMTWSGYETLAGYREIAMTLWLAEKDSDDAAQEVRKRVSAIRTGGDRRDWAPF